MKRWRWFPYFLLCALLLCYSDTATNAARDTVSLWLTRVLPALFPFYVASALLVSGGLFDALIRRSEKLLLPACFVLGAVAGYPVGARLCAAAGRSEWSVCCNLCSPAFLIGVCAIGLLGSAQLAAPLMLAHYGAALLSAIVSARVNARRQGHTVCSLSPLTMPQAISDGMLAMLRIGGCVVFFSVCAALAEKALRLPGSALSAGLTCLLEMTAGCQAFSRLPLPMRLKCACMAAAVSLGGLSVYMQTRGTDARIPAARYLTGKAFQAALSFLIAYGVTPWFYAETSSVLAVSADSLLSNASAMASLLLAASTGMVFAYLFGLCMKKARRQTGAGR